MIIIFPENSCYRLRIFISSIFRGNNNITSCVQIYFKILEEKKRNLKKIEHTNLIKANSISRHFEIDNVLLMLQKKKNNYCKFDLKTIKNVRIIKLCTQNTTIIINFVFSEILFIKICTHGFRNAFVVLLHFS